MDSRLIEVLKIKGKKMLIFFKCLKMIQDYKIAMKQDRTLTKRIKASKQSRKKERIQKRSLHYYRQSILI